MNAGNMAVLINTIGAVESGSQVYGKRRYEAYTAPYTNSNEEVTVTLGWAQNYGSQARLLLQMIFYADKSAFRKLDNASIESMLSHDWVAEKWNPTSKQKKALIALIDSEKGHYCQDALFQELMDGFISDCGKAYTNNVKAQMMYCEIRHLGGKSAVDRIFKRCNGNYSLDSIMNSLKQDQNDKSNNNQVGDKTYWSRHEKCRSFIDQYAIDETRKGEAKMSKTEFAISQMEAWAADDSHGYDQIYRWGQYGDYDCSSAVIQAWENAGVPVKSSGATYTGNMYNVFLRNGFSDVTASVNRSNAAGMIRGDVLLNINYHVAMYCGNGNEVEASINEFGGVSGGQPGDQTGWEFLIRGYRNYPWDVVLRYKDAGTEVVTALQKGDKGDAVKKMQEMLIAIGYSCGTSGADGSFGKATEKALKAFQSDYGLEVDGYYGGASEAALTKAYNEKTKPTSTWKVKGTATCTEDNVNLRQEPAGKIIGQLFTGQRFEVDGNKSGDWVHIKVAGIGICWIHKNYVSYDTSTSWKAKGTATVIADDVNVRSTPTTSTNSNIMGVLNKGQRFEIDGKMSGDWYHVKVAGLGIGYIHKNWVKKD